MGDASQQRAQRVAAASNAVTQITIAWIAATWRWLTGNLQGCFLLLVATYLSLRWRHGEIRPFSASQLLEWFSTQSTQTKLTLSTLTLTMLGFMFAFWTTSLTWRRHRELELRIEAAKEIHVRLQPALTKLAAINLYLSVLRTATVTARNLLPTNPAGAAWHIHFPNSASEAFLRDRADFDAALVEVGALRDAYSTVMANVADAPAAMRRAEDALRGVKQVLWSVNPPRADPASETFVTDFLAQCNDALFAMAHSEGTKAHERASTLAGFARGRLLRQVVPPNLHALWGISRNWRSIARFVPHISGRNKSDGTQ